MVKALPPKSIQILRGDSFDISFHGLGVKYKNQIKSIFEAKRFKASQTGASYRIVNSWFEQGVINASQESDGWRVFSTVENIWVQIAMKLRAFGYPLNKIKMIKKGLFDNEYEYEKFLYYLSHPLLRKPIQQVYFLASAEGDYELALMAEVKASKELGLIPDHISIDINYILGSFFNSLELVPTFSNMDDLTDEEVLLLFELRTKKYDSIEIKFQKGTINMLEGVEVIDPKNQVNKILKDHKFQSIEVIKQDGKVVHIKRKVKKKLA
jgi:DNA-binding transcriptional MerR regulator